MRLAALTTIAMIVSGAIVLTTILLLRSRRLASEAARSAVGMIRISPDLAASS